MTQPQAKRTTPLTPSPHTPACHRTWLRRAALLTTTAALTLALSACGGGYGSDGLYINAYLSGQVTDSWSVPAGGSQSMSINAGQPFDLDANEPVTWTVDIGGVRFAAQGLQIDYAGLHIRPTPVSASRVAVDVTADFGHASPVTLTFRATSNLDSALVANVSVRVY
ncbi:MAG: hypothetical protein AB9M53_09055 [Leptothrix sp. (in: b-proteobacteria)]